MPSATFAYIRPALDIDTTHPKQLRYGIAGVAAEHDQRGGLWRDHQDANVAVSRLFGATTGHQRQLVDRERPGHAWWNHEGKRPRRVLVAAREELVDLEWFAADPKSGGSLIRIACLAAKADNE